MYDIIYKFSVRKTIYHNNKLSMTFSVWKLKNFSPYQVILYIIVKRKCGRKGKKTFFLWFLFLFQKISNARIISNAHTLYAYRFFLYSLTHRHFFSSVYILTRREKRERKIRKVCVYISKSTCISQIKRANELLWFICIFTLRVFFLFSVALHVS